MSLLDEFIERKKGYILAKDLLINLSGMNNKWLYEIVNYLLCSDLNQLGFYHISSIYKIKNVNSDDNDFTNDFLEEIKDAIEFGDHRDKVLVYSNDDDLEHFSCFTKNKIVRLTDYYRCDYYFKKSELLSFKALDGLLHLDAINDEPPPNDNQIIMNMQDRIGELLDVIANRDYTIKLLSDSPTTSKDSANNQRIDELEKQLSKADAALTDIQNTTEQPQGIAKYNAHKALFIATGKAVASYLWSMDATQGIKTGDMVQQIIEVMHKVDANLLPDDKAIRGWLSDIAPDYAKKGGKPPNNAPSVISLSMKK